ncbi:MAG: undecaprenyldiphospho-muramoylpentapeptide beta-N-acetylglucosaminyltransferase [Candidatus Yanofskybacteria bacterium RIFCSPLOWO2_01_FULL_49_17]|uniref:UDP-N-acetylglucosamine--N-acetylmuramyl-(pentapeptide) pyrophosphoryl-undecaprenol N-acetylglucosamine transferase n=1 Tax=Candidatus Yanofskybacteria bacterium RIFCSPLOWO2_01_FULL_49_17 TaxID=1802700 RepID=A0A1F8GSN1_9BACT|nr:MAG: undecaprenyldiphospho-muramoylpentapeptide beta-N-acetylglucosaminyltransferase [Candidatus Yanofskybacteria bacterium RIFCSPLOWO2_01_FULL_49_17]
MKRILLVGGGTGGHVFPLVAVAEALKQLDPSVDLVALGEGPFMGQAIAGAGIPYHSILAGKMRRYFSFWNILDPFKTLIGFVQSLWWLWFYMPDMVFCKGGYVSFPPALAAKLYFIPIYTHESDSTPGAANSIIGKLAKMVFISFESTAKFFKEGKTKLVGNPVRPALLNGNHDAALQSFNLRADKKTIFVAGGSLGSKHINEAILESLVQLVQQFQVIHQCGQSQLADVQSVVEKTEKEGEASYGAVIKDNYRLYPFLTAEQMAMAYAAADVVISRGGSSAIFELAALGTPAIIIPLSTQASRGDQVYNAAEFQKFGAVMIEESNLTSHILINQIEELLQPAKYQQVSQSIKQFAKPEAANIIANTLLS